MKNRFCRKGIRFLYVACLLSAVGLTYSCKDDYTWDDTMPSYLKGSIYDELKANGNFKTTIKLIDDLNYSDVLARTGSKTLFVANDDAYADFFKEGGNPWGVTSYEELTTVQKKRLLNSAMLNNAYVLEMMGNVQSSGAPGSADYNSGRNLCLRQPSAATITDEIPYFTKDELPYSLNNPADGENADKQFGLYWNWLRENKDGIFMVPSKENPMITHFLEGNMNFRGIRKSDAAFVIGLKDGEWQEDEDRSYIYNARVIKQDVTCMNGYYHELDRVLLTPDNMAEVIRTNGKTNIFSHILDRFSAPYRDGDLTIDAKNLYPSLDIDSVYIKRYFAQRSYGGKPWNIDPTSLKYEAKDVMQNVPLLTYDPAWNSYASPALGAQQDMAAMFVPSDKALLNYFTAGAGQSIMNRYAPGITVTEDNLIECVDQIPMNIISELVNNLMQNSFNETVPSKYLTIMNDARDQMFPKSAFSTESAYKASIDECLMANNGVVYVMNSVTAPAGYAAVSAPVLYSKDARIVNTVIRADDNYIDGNQFNNAPLKQYFSTYLKAMQSNFSFFVPTDAGLAKYGYVDPASLAPMNKDNYRYWTWSISDKPGILPITAEAWYYKESTAQSGNPISDGNVRGLKNDGTANLQNFYGKVKRLLLIEMINQHIIVHDKNNANGVLGASQKYFISRDGAPVYVKAQGAGTNGVGMVVQGGWQKQLEEDSYATNDDASICTVTEAYDQTRANPANNNYGNGRTYFLDRPMQPTSNSVYTLLNSNEDFSEFLALANSANGKEMQELLDSAGYKEIAIQDALNMGSIKDRTDFKEADWNNYCNSFTIFASGELGASKYNGSGKEGKLVRSFNNYRYTIYVPSNNAVKAAISKGLPTLETIKANMLAYKELVPETTDQYFISEDNKARLRAQITMLENFIKYHFQDESLFVDNVSSSGVYQTQSLSDANVYITLSVKQDPDKITVTDRNGEEHEVVTAAGKYNLLARDANFNASASQGAGPHAADGKFDTDNCNHIKSSSYAVIHNIDGVLNFYAIGNKNYDAAWKTPTAAKRFVKKYHTQK